MCKEAADANKPFSFLLICCEKKDNKTKQKKTLKPVYSWERKVNSHQALDVGGNESSRHLRASKHTAR